MNEFVDLHVLASNFLQFMESIVISIIIIIIIIIVIIIIIIIVIVIIGPILLPRATCYYVDLKFELYLKLLND